MPTTLSLILAITPGVYAWWTGRKLIALRDDPVLAERMMAYRGRVALLCILAMAAVIVLASARLGPRLLLLVPLAALAGAFPCRKALLGETWSFTAYLEFTLRFVLAFAGFRLLLLFTPLLVATAGNWRWQASVLLALLLFGWLCYGLRVITALIGAKTLHDADLQARFEAVAARSTAPMPKLLRADFSGGRVANAFALPATPRPSVLFTGTLLDELQPAEAAAIFAHEMAHLEHMDARFIKKWVLLAAVLIVVALSIVPLAETWLGADALQTWQLILAGTAVVVALSLLSGQGRHHEAASDRRAVELCGDAEALIRGLTRLHEIYRTPRRWDAVTESASTHPSLANRIRSIREAAGIRHEPIDAPCVVTSLDAGRYAILDAERMHWLEGVPANSATTDATVLRETAASVTSLAYTELRELLLQPSAGKGAVLAAADRKGRRWTLRLSTEQIAGVQKILSQLDGKVNQQVFASAGNKAITLLIALGICGVALGTMKFFLIGLFAAIGVFYTRLYVLGALGFMAAAEGLLVLLQGFPDSGAMLLPAIALLILGLAASGYALYSNRKSPQPSSDKFIWALAALFLLLSLSGWLELGLTAADGLNPFRLHQIAQNFPEAATALFGLAGLSAIAGHKRRRFWAAGLLCIAAALPLALQSAYFGEHLAHDLFAVHSMPLAWDELTLESQQELDTPAFVNSLRLSPQGNSVAYRRLAYRENEPMAPAAFVIADFNGHSSEVQASDLAFVDERRVLIIDSTTRGKQLHLLELRQNAWQQLQSWHLPEVHAENLAWNGATGQWRIMGINTDNDKLLVISGKPGGEQPAVVEYPYRLQNRYAHIHAISGSSLIAAQMVHSGGLMWPYFELWASTPAQWHKLGDTTAISVECLSAPPGTDAPVICTASQRDGNLLVGALHAATGRLEPVLQISGRQALNRPIQQDQQLFFKTYTNHQLVVDLAAQRAWDLTLPITGKYVSDSAIAGKRLAVLSLHSYQERGKIQLFEIPAAFPQR